MYYNQHTSMRKLTMRRQTPFLIIALLLIVISCNYPTQPLSQTSPFTSATVTQILSNNAETIYQVSSTLPPFPTNKLSPAPTHQLTPTSTHTPLPSLTPLPSIPPLVSYGPLYFPQNINPLTGLEPSNPQLLERRPIAVKIPNVPRSVRPQFGVSLADHVYEYYLEWGLTRFIAIFYGNDAIKAGPIRSARFFDENIFRMYKSIFVFNGADDQVEEYLLNTDYKNLFVVDRDCPPLCRDKSIPGYNNLFGNTEDITNYINKRGVDNSRQDLSGIYFRSYASRSNEYATKVYVRFSMFDYHYWEYDKIAHHYVRFQDANDAPTTEDENYVPLTDRLTEKPITADNLVILFVPHKYYLKSSDTEIFQMDFMGAGKAYFFREGYAYDAEWVRASEDRLLSILLSNGKPAPFKLGNSWFIVINDISEVSHDDDTWRFEFVLPEIEDE